MTKAILASVVAIVLIVAAWFAYRAIAGRVGPISSSSTPGSAALTGASGPPLPATPADLKTLFPTAPAPCPADPNDLAGIEGYAPGAGGAAKTGQTGAGDIGSLGGGLGGEATPAPAAGPTCSGITPGVAEYFDRVSQRADTIPDDGFDPRARAGELADAGAMFVFVRDRIRTEAYAGLMRGPGGTLQARGGSPLDKAYLLAVMLQTIGVPVQLVHAPLADGDIQPLVDRIKSSARPADLPSPQLADALQRASVDAMARAHAAENAARTDAMADHGIAAAQPSVGRLVQALGSHASLASTDSAIMAEWRANLRDHWWLRVQQGGAWIDWDPTLPGAQPGTHLGAAPQGDGLAEPPADQKTALTIRLTADYADRSSARTLVEASSTLDQIDALSIAVSIGDRDRGSADLKNATSFTPAIRFGDDETAGDAFQLDPDGGPRVAALHVQIQTSGPGQPPHVVTRTLIDRRNDRGAIDPSWTPERTAYGATTALSILTISGELDPGFVARREADGLKALRSFVTYVAAGGYGRQSPPTGMAAAYPMEALHYFEQDAIVRRRLEDGVKARFFFDRPQIAMMRRSLAASGSGLAGREQFDIVDNGMVATGTDPAAAINANFTRGYLDTVIEQHLLAVPTDGGAIALFAAAQAAGVPLSVSTDPKYGGPTAIVVSRPVASGGRARTGWWQVDPATGNLVGRMDDGAGQGLAEYALARANDWFTIYAMLQFYGDFFRCIAGAVEAPLAGRELGSVEAQNWFKECAGAALCSYLESLAMSEAFSRMDSDMLALIYNILDMSIPGSKDAWGPTLGNACGKIFTNPFG